MHSRVHQGDEDSRNLAAILQIHKRSFPHVIMLFLYLLPILNRCTVKFAMIQCKPIGYAFTPLSYSVLASADRNEVFAVILGASEVMKSQNTANKNYFSLKWCRSVFYLLACSAVECNLYPRAILGTAGT